LRRRHRGVVRGLGRLTELGFKLGDAPGQGLNLRLLRQHDQLVLGELPVTGETPSPPFYSGDFFTVTDDIVSSGSMDFEVSCCLQPWPAYFVHGNVGAYGFLPGESEERTTSAIDIDFLADGLLSGTFNVLLDHDKLLVGGIGTDWSGYIDTDPSYPPPEVTGYWINAALVPEPRSVALLFSALLGTIWFHRRRIPRFPSRLPRPSLKSSVTLASY
jgi:hypothetical protein